METLATLVCGLRDNSRTKMFLADAKVDVNTVLLGTIADRLALLVWMRTEDGHKGRNRPKSVVETWFDNKDNDVMTFASLEDFEAYRQSIIEKG